MLDINYEYIFYDTEIPVKDFLKIIFFGEFEHPLCQFNLFDSVHSLQMRFKEEFSECGLDTEEYSDLAARMLAKVKTGRLYKFKQFIFHLLEQNLKKFQYLRRNNATHRQAQTGGLLSVRSSIISFGSQIL